MDDSLWRVVSIKINWWLRETSWALFLPLKGNWNGSAVMARRWPGPGAATSPCQIPTEPLGPFGPAFWGRAVGGCRVGNALWLYPVSVDVSQWDLSAGSRWGGRSLPGTRCCRSLGWDLAP